MEKIKQMIRSHDPEIAILGAKLMLQQDEKEALKTESRYYMGFYKDKKGEFHIVRALKFNNSNGHIHILSENEINNIVKYDGEWDTLITDNKVINLIKQEYEQRETVAEHNI